LSYRDVVRAKVVLMAADGLDNDEIAARLDTRREILSKWRKRLTQRRSVAITCSDIRRAHDSQRLPSELLRPVAL
jgi:uncharacterized membrane protein